MITCSPKFLIERCMQRGYALSEVMACVVAQTAEAWTIDPEHPAYPKTPRPGFELKNAIAAKENLTGPGTMLAQQLKKIGIYAGPNCACRARAQEMNDKGNDWCEQNIDTIVGWLREEATKRKLPFVDFAGRVLIKRAIKLSRAAEADALQECDEPNPPPAFDSQTGAG